MTLNCSDDDGNCQKYSEVKFTVDKQQVGQSLASFSAVCKRFKLSQ